MPGLTFFSPVATEQMESSSKKRRGDATKQVILHVFVGGESGVQQGHFKHALAVVLSRFKKGDIEVVFMTTSQLRQLSIEAFVDWLLASHFYFILSHAHQSLHHWDCRDIAPQYSRLMEHIGFPTHNQLYCPIFLQDKFAYLEAIPEFCNATVKVSFPWDEASRQHDTEKISQMLLEGNGWVVKTGFSTNCDNFKICRTIEKVCSSSLFVEN